MGEAADGRQAVAMARELHPDVVFMDTYMPRMTGLVAAKLLGKHAPRVKVLMYSPHNEREYVLQIIRSGARGYVLKNAPPEELADAIQRVNEGQTYYNSDVARLALDEYTRNAREGRPAPFPISATAKPKCSAKSPKARAAAKPPPTSASASAPSKPTANTSCTSSTSITSPASSNSP